LKKNMTRRSFAGKAAAAVAAVPAIGAAIQLAPQASAQEESLVATMVTDTAGLGDQNFNDLANAGGTRAAEELGIEFKVIESTDATTYVPNLTAAAEQGKLAIGVGFLLTEAITAVAGQFPDDHFLLIDAVSEAPNVESVTFKEEQGAFLAGVAAGLMTQSNIVGAVGGIAIPPVVRYMVGYEAGAKSANPECEVQIGYADTFDDPALGKEMTLAQYNNGADISMPAAGRTGIGGFEAAKEKGEGFWVIAADADQEHLGPGFQLGFVRKGVDTTVFQTISEVVAGEFRAGAQNFGLEVEYGIGFEDPYGRITPEAMATIEKYKAAIVAGTIVVPTTEEELAAFEPVPADSLPEVEATPSA
jgi:basic membrane protein A